MVQQGQVFKLKANPRESGSWWQRDFVSTEYGEMLLLLTQTIASLGALNAQH